MDQQFVKKEFVPSVLKLCFTCSQKYLGTPDTICQEKEKGNKECQIQKRI